MDILYHVLSCVQISFGGMPLSLKPSSGGRDNFVGCMEGITYNNDNITNMVRRKKVDTSSFVRQHLSVLGNSNIIYKLSKIII